MLCLIYLMQIQSRKQILDRAAYAAPTRQDELNHTDQQQLCPQKSTSRGGNRLSVRCVACSIRFGKGGEQLSSAWKQVSSTTEGRILTTAGRLAVCVQRKRMKGVPYKVFHFSLRTTHEIRKPWRPQNTLFFGKVQIS